ncbi:hypothetical protein [Actinomadura sp. RB99]|uniref:hypothetical protein n=1 Tax=Actinomadura sp. RB99 TaxID=2691577 RepID=UPI001687C8B5|nr:hypothetical protein [Actinomadura sp. RB99]
MTVLAVRTPSVRETLPSTFSVKELTDRAVRKGLLADAGPVAARTAVSGTAAAIPAAAEARRKPRRSQGLSVLDVSHPPSRGNSAESVLRVSTAR